MQMAEATFHSGLLRNERRLWVQPPSDIRTAEAICIFLDGEYYVERMNAPTLLEKVQESGAIPPMWVIYVSHVDGPTRWIESFCNEHFARCLSEELVPWVMAYCGESDRNTRIILGGLSLTGLAAAHAALIYQRSFSGVICQSASFWWSDNHLMHEVRNGCHLPQTFRIVCGSQERQGYVEHGPDLIQRTSQLSSNVAMRDALLERGHHVFYEEYDGGHDIGCWKSDLPNSIKSLFTR